MPESSHIASILLVLALYLSEGAAFRHTLSSHGKIRTRPALIHRRTFSADRNPNQPGFRLHDGSFIVSNLADLTDPPAVEFASNTFDSAVNSFFGSMSSRLLGTLIGNLVAGVTFKFLLDNVFNRKNDGPSPTQTPEVKEEPQTPPISQQAWLKLALCIFIDLISDSSFLLPGIGEAEDVAWAPISAFIMRNIFNSDRVGVAEFAKEILPFTDIIPLATALWVLENVLVDSPINDVLGMTANKPKPTSKNKDIIEAEEIKEKESKDFNNS
mmetsp:Transcript_2994/g.4636  ORF Transcript_2994/g.4636 Transcript_2994/m.4636 type:complete len:270 (+) Transcript_2994:62-871(+)|eukprot:CAMPEP_0174969850 /NCGR_PEP_ID=MMETSP0004_2-20121128/9012_1 /TAXON_ID=420556 /ORGANISM="Ochromonas sp., Strain CCMP1393" /LENGTH=269 /DNA_ID=CAMNT_0016219427 /DNA_START=25 /DNA_END=834 /DNA_ORIENTATION=+